MAQQALYRRWRSQTFAEVVGQEHVTVTLKNAVAHNRAAHAYLLYGPRGTGKTSTGRILAKALNCVQSVDGEPCNQCPQCVSIKEGRSMDLVEIDAASNRGIDDIRDLRDKVNYAPSEGRYRVYIIDEVHMLTTEAANALLKTLEEPPPHTKFVLATTEIHRILPTILSRCQQFQFRPISNVAVCQRLSLISQTEGLTIDEAALEYLARVAGGSLRDAENLLDQLVAHFGETIDLVQVQSLLGRTEDDRAVILVEQVFTADLAGALEAINALAWEGGDMRQFARTILNVLRTAIICKTGASITLDITPEMQARIAALAEKVSLAQLLAVVKRFTQTDLRAVEESILLLELAAVESALLISEPQPALEPVVERPKPVGQVEPTIRSEQRPAVTSLPPAADPFAEPTGRPPVSLGEPQTDVRAIREIGESIEQLAANWGHVVDGLHHSNKMIGALLRGSCEPLSLEQNVLTLGFYYPFHKEKMESPQNRKAVEEALFKVVGKRYEVSCVLTSRDAKTRLKAVQSDPVIKAALELGGRLAEDS